MKKLKEGSPAEEKRESKSFEKKEDAKKHPFRQSFMPKKKKS